MATIDRLDIQIEGSAQKANQAIDSLITNLGRLANSLKIDTSGLEKIGRSLNFNGISNSAKAISAQTKQISRTLESVSEKYKDLGKDFKPSDSLKKAQSQLLRYSDLLQKAKLDKESLEASGDVNTKGYDTAVKNFYRYGNVIENIKKKIEELNHTPVKLNLDFSQMSEEELDKELGFPNVSTWADKISQSTKKIVEDSRESAREFTGVWNGIELLNFDSDIKNLGDKLSQLEVPPIREENLHKLRASLEKTESKLDELRENLENGITMGRITESIDDSGYVKLQEQIAATEKTAAALRDRINEVGKASQGAAGIKEVGKASDKASDSFSKLSKNTLKASNSLKKMQSGLKGILRAFLPILGIRELVRFGKESIKSSMDYLEVLNYFDAAFGQVASNADLSAFEEMGYDSADAYYNSFAQRAQELTAKMSGFTVGEGGLLESTGAVSLGLDPSQLMNYQAMFAQMSSSMGVSSENALKLSQALTEIGADLASIKNMEFEDVWNDMSSGLAGMSRTLDKYGVNIRNVNLQQKLSELGIEANIQALNQNDIALLRAIILLENTKYAWGDLADTINQPANQLRLIQANFQNLSRTIGNLFLPVVKTALPYINALVIAVQRLFAWLGNLIGIDISDISTSIGGADIGGILDQTDDLSDSLGGVATNAKKAKAGLRAFDELKTISMPEESKGGGGAGGIGGGLLDAAFEDAFSKYQEKWDKEFAGLENKAQEWADKISAPFKFTAKNIKEGFDSAYDSQKTEKLKENISEIAELNKKVWQSEEVKTAVEQYEEQVLHTTGAIIGAGTNISNSFGIGVTGGIAKAKEKLVEFDKTKISSIFGNLTNISKTVEDLSKAFSKIGEAFESEGFQKIVEFFYSLADVTLLNGLDTLTGVAGDIFNLFAKPIIDNADKLKEVLKKIFDIVSNLLSPFQDLIDKISGNSEKYENSFIHKLFTELSGSGSQNFSNTLDIVLSGLEKIEKISEGASTSLSNFFSEINEKSETAKEKFSELWNSIQGVWGEATGWFNDTIIQPVSEDFEDACKEISEFFSDLWSGIKKGAVSAFNVVISGIETAINWIVDGVNDIISVFNGVAKWGAKIAGQDYGGVDLIPKVTLGKIDISGYAVGGFPKIGQLFIANEAGPELIGNMNGRTTVAPQNDIAEGFAQAIYPAVYNAVSSAIKNSNNNQEAPEIRVYIGNREITDIVIDGITERAERNKKMPFPLYT